MLLMIDNYDSFTFTLVQYFQALGQEVKVIRNDAVSIAKIRQLNPDRIVISPGPCSPSEAGISVETVQAFYQSKPILGVCLGHQAIAQAFNAKVIKAREVKHGKTSLISHNKSGLYHGLPTPYMVTRYHSLIVDHNSLPDFIEPTSWSVDKNGLKDELMGLQLTDYPVAGVQFHPESVLTEHGLNLLANFLDY